MKHHLIHILIAILLLAVSHTASARYEYKITITENQAEKYVVELISTYSDYYNENVPGSYPTKIEARNAGRDALDALTKSGVHDEPEACWYDVDWM